MSSDERFMQLALEAARRGLGHTAPNPAVGAVLVRGKKILAVAHHQGAGLPHAEAEIFQQIPRAPGATLYVTLEPCCHTKKRTPPCTDAILRSGVRRVVVGCRDANPQVSGRGLKKLRQAGIDVEIGVLEGDCLELNRAFFHWIGKGEPWVTLKVASSLDGKLALANGKSQWITAKPARARVHALRAECDGILVGVGTVLADDPNLTVRGISGAATPRRIVLDPQLRIPERAKVLANPEGQVLVVTKRALVSQPKAQRLREKGVEILHCPTLKSGEFVLAKLLPQLGERGLLHLLVEGGAATWTSFLRQGCFQELQVFLAPKILGGDAKSWSAALGLKRLPENPEFRWHSTEFVGSDLCLKMRPSS